MRYEEEVEETSFNTTACVGSRISSISCLYSSSSFNTTACVGSSRCIHNFNLCGKVSIQLLVSVRGIKPAFYAGICLFQYNCLCRFEITAKRLIDKFGRFQYNCLCRFEMLFSLFIIIYQRFNTTACVGSRKKHLEKP